MIWQTKKTKNIIKYIVNPSPDLFVNNTFDANKDLNTNIQKYTDNPYVLKPEVQKQLNDTVLQELITPPVLDPKIPKPSQDIFDPPVSSVQPPIPERSIPNEVPYILPIPELFVPPSVPDCGELPPPYEEPSPPYEPPPPYEDPEDIFINNEIDDQSKISLVPVDKTHGNFVAMPSDNEVEIKKSLNDSDIQVTLRPTSDTYARTK